MNRYYPQELYPSSAPEKAEFLACNVLPVYSQIAGTRPSSAVMSNQNEFQPTEGRGAMGCHGKGEHSRGMASVLCRMGWRKAGEEKGVAPRLSRQGDGWLSDAPRSRGERARLGAMGPPSCGSPFAQQILLFSWFITSSGRGSTLGKRMGARPA